MIVLETLSINLFEQVPLTEYISDLRMALQEAQIMPKHDLPPLFVSIVLLQLSFKLLLDLSRHTALH